MTSVLTPEIPKSLAQIRSWADALVYLSAYIGSRGFYEATAASPKGYAEAVASVLSKSARRGAEEALVLGSLDAAFGLMREHPQITDIQTRDLKQGYVGRVYGQQAVFHSAVAPHLIISAAVQEGEVELVYVSSCGGVSYSYADVYKLLSIGA